MQTTINNPAIAQGFQALQQAFFPDPSRVIEADLARRKGMNIDADTRYRDASTGKVSAETGVINYKQHQLQSLVETFTGANLADPSVRQALGAAMLGAGIDPGNLTGASVYANPGFVAPGDLATIMLGTGVVDNYGQTQPGQAAALQNDLDVQRLRNEGAVAQQAEANKVYGMGSKPGAPMDVSPNDVAKIADMLVAALTTQTGVAPEDIDPGYLQQLQTAAAAAYQRNRDAASAITSAIGAMPPTVEKYDKGLFDISALPFTEPDGRRVTGAAAPQPAQPAQTVQPGQTATLPDGSKVRWDGQQWAPLK